MKLVATNSGAESKRRASLKILNSVGLGGKSLGEFLLRFNLPITSPFKSKPGN